MYQPKQNKIFHHFFLWYISYIIRKDFASYQFNSPTLKKDCAVLVLANHFSWWDGFMIWHINKLFFKKKFHVMVSGENYIKNGFLKYVGAFAAENKGKDIIETLQYAGKLLDDPNNLVLVFPQGKLYSNHVPGIHFEKGIMHIINASNKKLNILFSVTLIDYFAKRKPSAFTYLHHWVSEEYTSLQLLKSEYNKHYEQSVVKQTEISE